MEVQATAALAPPRMASAWRRAGWFVVGLAWRVAAAVVIMAAWVVAQGRLYTPASQLGYWLGVTGGSLMVVMLIYPLRKRYPRLSLLGPIRYWFRFHMVAGIGGPLIVLFHSTFHVGSFNAAIALASMLLVVASGLVGRFLYRRIHRGLYGSRETAAELQQAMAHQLAHLQPLLVRMPALEREISQFVALANQHPPSRWQRAVHFMLLGWRCDRLARRVRRALQQHRGGLDAAGPASDAALLALTDTITEALQAVQRAGQFATFENLFALWHVVHVPFLCMLVITAILHVVAVHAY
jgi:hypothetical protein